jgi:hypothetical protein
VPHTDLLQCSTGNMTKASDKSLLWLVVLAGDDDNE